MSEHWTPWKSHLEGLPEPGDYVRLKCGCMGTYREGIYLGTEPDGRLKMAPYKGGFARYCHWSKRIIGDLSETDRVKEEELV